MDNGSDISKSLEYFRGRTVVVKYGGAAMQSPEQRRDVVTDIATLRAAGVNVVLVHGGGPELTALQEQLNIETRFEDGLRYTDAATLDAALMTLCGKVNKNLVRMLENEGAKAAGLCGIDGGLLICRRQKDPDLGFVGEIVKVGKELLHLLMIGNIIPVVAPVGLGEDGLAYNINADTAAGRIAASLSADCIVTLSDIAGVMRDVNDPSSLICALEAGEIEGLIEEGVIFGGMIPKVRGLADAIERGAKSASIANGSIPHALLLVLSARAAIETGRMPGYEEAIAGTTITGQTATG